MVGENPDHDNEHPENDHSDEVEAENSHFERVQDTWEVIDCFEPDVRDLLQHGRVVFEPDVPEKRRTGAYVQEIMADIIGVWTGNNGPEYDQRAYTDTERLYYRCVTKDPETGYPVVTIGVIDQEEEN